MISREECICSWGSQVDLIAVIDLYVPSICAYAGNRNPADMNVLKGLISPVRGQAETFRNPYCDKSYLHPIWQLHDETSDTTLAFVCFQQVDKPSITQCEAFAE